MASQGARQWVCLGRRWSSFFVCGRLWISGVVKKVAIQLGLRIASSPYPGVEYGTKPSQKNKTLSAPSKNPNPNPNPNRTLSLELKTHSLAQPQTALRPPARLAPTRVGNHLPATSHRLRPQHPNRATPPKTPANHASRGTRGCADGRARELLEVWGDRDRGSGDVR